ncbi:right-handed parallel beta-helix repeat-containing protein [Methylobacterium sp. ID0610]|uniref:right-handed parallel beta-helix repeat-containing protein n=1 Tax=Methylobacterium carpenticola TaxID=3344827 RepID=UPI0036CEC951
MIQPHPRTRPSVLGGAARARRGRAPAGGARAGVLLLLAAAPALAAGPDENGRPACPAGAIRIAPGSSIQEAVERAGEGARFCIGAGLHRMQIVTPRNAQSFVGEPGAVLDGSRRIESFTRSGRFWVAGGQPAPFDVRGSCLAGRPCTRRAGLFLDGAPLRQVERREEMGPDTFLFDPLAGTIVLAQDPAGHVVETARAAFAFSGRAADVRIAGLVIEKYNSAAQYGAVQAAAGRGWQITHTEARHNSGAGIVLGPGATLSDSVVHHNGQLGVGGVGDGLSLLRSRIFANNTHGYDPDWEAGGVKMAQARTVVMRGNHVHENHGPGLWCDIDCERVLFEDNRVEGNDGPGIFYEISRMATIRGNRLVRNGAGPRAWVWGAEIQVAASADVEVVGNDLTVAPGGHGVILVDQGRPRARGGYYETRGNTVHDNVTTFDAIGRSGGTSDVPAGRPQAGIIEAGGNRFDRNTYRYRSGSEPLFLWGPQMSFAGFRQAGQEAGGQIRLIGPEGP